MRDLIIALNRIYGKYKLIIWGLVAIIVLYILLTSAMTNALKKNNNNSSSEKNTTTIVANNDVTNTQKTDAELVSSAKGDEDIIQLFVNFCNAGKIDSAYNLLTDECKQALYPTKEKFVSNYYNKYFKNTKGGTITEYSNAKKTYRVNYNIDSLSTGNTSQRVGETDFITITDDKKISVSSFVKKQEINKTEKNSYVGITVKNRYIFLDHEEYEIAVNNYINADIILNSTEDSCKSYIVDSNNNYHKLDMKKYNEESLKIFANGSRSIKLSFLKTYKENDEIASMLFDAIKIINQEYGDSSSVINTTTNGNDEQKTYERKMSTYPSAVSLQIQLK